ncbi:uncharacterized protein P174DRAFT_506908 [Aspergillus novofumigatus IBT 16806]|uniref:Uncharacterized protein n=1 Tax=Aspergillus novofumigatus (strain IBT 16806) TaxID=1392255 RepID=A0A2I1BXI9_ASPN1|nr:uncharacterized protein P174DRAFT_506908 [Aspergillus novofumigatus IBT 16806]PKX90087.1 hypothetical protein P174DRAFT_506908 [Aspergillus novofumigatus IBT 16806]
MNRELFWGSWMLDRLRKLVRGTDLIPQKAYLEDVSAQCPKYASVVSTGPSFAFGTNPDHPNPDDSYFGLTDKGSSWSWSKSATPSTVSVAVPSTKSSRTVTETANSAMRVTFVSGGQKIAITGSNSFEFHYSSSEGGYATLTTETSWHLNFALGAVSDGPGMELPVRRFRQSYLGHTENWFNNSLAWLTNDLISALKHHHKLYLPASGVFLMQDAKFNKRGDLLLGLHYNG